MTHTPEEILTALDEELQKLYAAQMGPPMLGVKAAEDLMESLTTFKLLGQQIVAQADERLLVVAQCRARYFALAEFQGSRNPISIN